MQAGEVKITKVAESIGAAVNGQQQREVVITFNVGPHGPFTERFTATPFDPAAANARLAAFAQALGLLNSAA